MFIKNALCKNYFSSYLIKSIEKFSSICKITLEINYYSFLAKGIDVELEIMRMRLFLLEDSLIGFFE